PRLNALDLTHRWFMTETGMGKGHVLHRNDGIESSLQREKTVKRMALTVSQPSLVVSRMDPVLRNNLDASAAGSWFASKYRESSKSKVSRLAPADFLLSGL